MKKRRDGPVDWKKFYGSQPPKEIIIIDDTPVPDGSVTVSTVSNSQQTPENGSAAHGYANGTTTSDGAAAAPVRANKSFAQRIPKRRKRDDDIPATLCARYRPVHHSSLNSTTTPWQQSGTPSGMANSSSGRTDSAIHTIAATSLESWSSNSQYDDDTQPVQKRKQAR